jgi:phasin family protein
MTYSYPSDRTVSRKLLSLNRRFSIDPIIVAIDHADKTCSPVADIALRKHFAVQVEGRPTRQSTEKASAGEMLFFDFTKLMSQFRLPGVDFAALVDRERKNIEALAEANRIAFESWQSLVRRQSKILQETMKNVVASAGQEDAMKKRADLAKDGFEKALSKMRELAEMAAKTQKEAFEVIRKRG